MNYFSDFSITKAWINTVYLNLILKLKEVLFFERISEVSVSYITVVLPYIACTSNTRVVHIECVASISYCRPESHYIQHSRLVTVNTI